MNQPLIIRRGGFFRTRFVAFGLLSLSAGAFDAFAAMTVGGGLMKFNVFGEVMSDSNVFGNTTDESDIVYTVRPQATYDREGSVGSTHFDAGVGFQRYSDETALNSENWSVNGSVTIPESTTGRLTGDANLSYFNGAEADAFVGQRADSERLSFGLNSSYLVSGRTSVRLGLTHSSYDTNIRPATDTTGLRAGVAWQLRQSLNAFFDYTRSKMEADTTPSTVNVVDFTTNQYTVGLSGQLNAIWSGSISAGVQSLDAASNDSGGDDDGFVANARLNWALRQNTSIGLSGGRSTRVTANADAIDATTVAINVAQKLGVALSATASLLWETYETRGLTSEEGDRLAASLSLDYSINDRFGCGGSIDHSVRDSNNQLLDISRTTVTIFGRVTF